MAKKDFSTGAANGGAGPSPYETMVMLQEQADELYSGLGNGTDLSPRLTGIVGLSSAGLLFVNGSSVGLRSLADTADIQWANADASGGSPAPTLKATGVTAGTYSLATLQVDAAGRVVSITSGSTTSGGEANTASNLAGTGLFSAKTGADLAFKGLVAGTGITLSADSTTVTVSSSAAAGEANTASSLGGEAVFSDKSGVDFRFKGLTAGAGIAIAASATALTITVDAVASEIPFTPAGALAATDVQAALVELDTEKAAAGHAHSDATTGTAGFMSAADKTKLDGVETGATADMSAAEILTAVKTVDGTGSGLDADQLDGNEASAFALLSGATFSGPVTVTGDLTVNGTTTTVNSQTVQVTDNLIVINYGEVGAGVTAGSAGIRVERGSATDYDFLFDESDDLFKVGQTGSLQAVATREGTPTDNGMPFWDAASSMFTTSGAPTWDGSKLTVPGTAAATGGMPLVTESTTARTFGLSDAGSYIRCTNASATTLTVPPNSTTAFATGAEIVVMQAGAGAVTFAAGAGVTINSKGAALGLSDQYAAATLKKVGTDTWDLIGDIA